jgi:lambda family phage minor tail protein L
MTTNAKIKRNIQLLDPGALITMYELDTTPIGGDDVYYFTNGTDSNEVISFNSIVYAPIPLEVDGFEWKGKDTLPRPTITVSNILLTFLGEVILFDDLVGAKLTRRRTFSKYLDGGDNEDGSAQFPPDVFYIERKMLQDKYVIKWELCSVIDLGKKEFPNRRVLQSCSHKYRRYLDGDFVAGTCPYNGDSYFDRSGSICDEDEDICGKKLFDCRLRYPETTDILPFLGFPGVGKLGAYR